MSNPVTNAEVEDVLSSIRRLVSEDKRPLQGQNAEPANDRLVLTPALRVAEVPNDLEDVDVPDTASSDATSTDVVPDDAAAQSDPSDNIIFNDPAHDYEADPYNFADDDDENGERDAAPNLSVPDAEIDIADGPEDDLDAEKPSQDDAKSDSIGATKTATLSAKIEALETAIGNIADTWEPDTPGSDDYSGTEAPAMAWEDEVDRDAKGAPLEDGTNEEDITDKRIEDDEINVQTAAPSRVTDDTAAASVSEPASQIEAEDETSGADGIAYGTDDQTIDEEALRDLVSDIVRAELQGALGERITRNVRKLVRREIHRALTAKELE